MTVNKRTLRALVVLELIGLMRKKKKKWTRKDNKLDQNREKLRYYGNIVQEWKTQMGFRR